MAYVIFGRQTCTTTGRAHFQDFISHKNRVRITTCKKLVRGAHFECVSGQIQENIVYCQKDGSFKKFGKRPVTTEQPGSFSGSIALYERGEFATIMTDYAVL